MLVALLVCVVTAGFSYGQEPLRVRFVGTDLLTNDPATVTVDFLNSEDLASSPSTYELGDGAWSHTVDGELLGVGSGVRLSLSDFGFAGGVQIFGSTDLADFFSFLQPLFPSMSDTDPPYGEYTMFSAMGLATPVGEVTVQSVVIEQYVPFSGGTVIDLGGQSVDAVSPVTLDVVAQAGSLVGFAFAIEVVAISPSWGSEINITFSHESGYSFNADGSDLDFSDDGPADFLFGWPDSPGVFSFSGTVDVTGALSDASGEWAVTLSDDFNDAGIDHEYLQGSTVTILGPGGSSADGRIVEAGLYGEISDSESAGNFGPASLYASASDEYCDDPDEQFCYFAYVDSSQETVIDDTGASGLLRAEMFDDLGASATGRATLGTSFVVDEESGAFISVYEMNAYTDYASGNVDSRARLAISDADGVPVAEWVIEDDESYSASYSFNDIIQLQPGVYSLFAEAAVGYGDDGSYANQAELDFDFEIIPGRVDLPDLEVADFVLPQELRAGDLVTLSWEVENVGDATASGLWTDQIVFSRTAEPDEDARLIADVSRDVPLAASESYTVEFSFRVPLDFEGDGFFTLVTDFGDVIPETDDEDNGASALAAVLPSEAQVAELPTVLAEDGLSYDALGSRIAVDGDLMAVSATGADVAGVSNAGAVVIFERVEGVWIQQARIESPSPQQSAGSNMSLSLSGDTLVVGMPNYDGADGSSSGEVYIYRRTGGDWVQEARLEAPVPEAGGWFGYSVAVGGDTAFVSHPFTDRIERDLGEVLVYKRAGTSWLLEQTLVPSDAESFDRFGRSIALSGGRLAVGASGYDLPGASSAGAVYIYSESSNGWQQEAVLVRANPSALDSVGYNVAFSGSAILTSYGFANSNRGHAFVFQDDGQGWRETATLAASDAQINDYFGYDIAIDGDTVLIGARFDDALGLNASGSTYVFRILDGAWTEYTKVMPSDTESALYFGSGAALSGTNAYLGATGYDLDGEPTLFNVGAVYQFQLAPDSATRPDLRPSDVQFVSVAQAGDSVSGLWSTTNIGPATAVGNWSDRIYFSSDDQLDDNDRFIAEAVTLGPLAPDDVVQTERTFQVPTDLLGTGFLLVEVNASGNILESDTDNNVVAWPIEIVPAPDLVALAVDEPIVAETYINDPLTVSWRVENASPTGISAGSGWIDRVFFSIDDSPSPSEIAGEAILQNVVGLPGSSIYTMSTGVMAPSAPGSYNIIVSADDDDDVLEATSSNNTVSRPSQLLVHEYPNLTVVSAGVSPTSVAEGTSFTLDWSGVNEGAGPAFGPWADRVVLSANGVYGDSDDIDLGVYAAGPARLSGGGTAYTNNATIPLPPAGDIVPGTFSVFVVANAGADGPSETDLSDNVIEIPATLEVRPDRPNLVVTMITGPSSASEGETVNVIWRVDNVGDREATGVWRDEIRLSLDSAAGDDTLLAYADHSGPLAAGEYYQSQVQVLVPIGAPDPWYLVVETDVMMTVDESINEGDNDLVDDSPIDLLLPQLVVEAASGPGSMSIGQSYEVSRSVRNLGPGSAARSWVDAAYLSIDEFLSEDDARLGASPASDPPLLADGSLTGSFEISAAFDSGTSPGTFYLLLKTDALEQQPETDDLDNVRVAGVVTVETPPNLAVVDIFAPSEASELDQIEVSWTVTNAGGEPASGAWRDEIRLIDESGAVGAVLAQAVFSGTLASGESYDQVRTITIPEGQFGANRVQIELDAGSDIDEYPGEADNVVPDDSPINVLLPDLVLDTSVGPDTAYVNEPFDVSRTVRNLGSGVARRSWRDAVYLSEDATWSIDDIRIGHSGSPGVLDSAGTYSGTITASPSVDSGVQPGTFNLILVADDLDTQPESNEENNDYRVGTIEIIEPPAPDLTVASVFAPSGGAVGTAIEVSWSVENQGDLAATSGWTDRVYLSGDTALDPDDHRLDEFGRVQPLSDGGSYSVVKAIELSGEPGLYYVLVETDATDSVDELYGETNNVLASGSQIEVLPRPQPDLRVQSIIPPSDGAFSGSTPEIRFVVENHTAATGPTTTSTWSDRVYLSTDEILKSGDTNLATLPNASYLEVGDSYEQVLSPRLPTDIDGSYYIIVKTDINNGQPETDDSNNTLVAGPFEVELEAQPDLRVASVVTPSAAFAGDTIEISLTEENSDTLPGSGAPTDTASWRVQIYISADAETTIGSDDQRLQTFTSSGTTPLDGGESRSWTRSVGLPVVLSGEWYVKVRTDSENVVSEFGFEGNNVGVSVIPINVTQPPSIDLVPIFVEVETSTEPGSTVGVFWMVENFGAPPDSAVSWQDGVYLSSDGVLDEGDTSLGSASASSGTDGDGFPLIHPYERAVDFAVPGDVAPGQYWVLVRTDDTESVYEGDNESNNVAVSESLLTVADLYADLAVASGVTEPILASAGSSVLVDWTVQNAGEITTHVGAWSDRVVFDRLGGGASTTLLTRERTGSLPPSGTYMASGVVTLPLVEPGSYVLRFEVDTAEAVVERDGARLNNAVEIPVTIDGDAADLTVALGAVPANAMSGDTLELTWTVTNTGSLPTNATAWNDRIQLVPDGGSAAPISTLGHSGRLDPGASYSEAISYTFPAEAAGFYTIRAEADSNTRVFEQSESNNSDAATVLVTRGPQPNLVASGVSSPSQGDAGRSIQIDWTVTNSGEAPTTGSSWTDRVYLSRDPSLDAGDTLVASTSAASGLSVSASYQQSVDVPLPVDAIGQYWAIVKVDADDQVFEDDRETDNVAAASAVIAIDAPDLIAHSVIAPEFASAGQPIDVCWTIENTGSDAIGSWRDTVYLSRDPFLNDADIAIGGHNHSVGLLASGQYSACTEGTVPRGLSGLYFVLVGTDSREQLTERSDLNNTGFALMPTLIVVPPPADIVVTSVDTPTETVTLGDNVEFSWSLGNDAAAQAPLEGQWANAVFLSQDTAYDSGDQFVGRFTSEASVSIEPGESFATTGAAEIPGVLPGDYHVIVRADTFNVIPETDESNNIGVSSSTISLDAEPLEFGIPTATDLPAGRSRWFRVDVPPGETVRVTLDHASALAWTELYGKRNSVPTTGDFDFIHQSPGSPDQQIIIDQGEDGIYYILARCTLGTGPLTQAVLTAETIPFGVAEVVPSVVGNAGSTTISIRGAKLDQSTAFTLVRTDGEGQAIRASWSEVPGPTHAVARFDLIGVEPGEYALNATKSFGALEIDFAAEELIPIIVPLEEGAAVATVEVVEGGGAEVHVETSLPAQVRAGRTFALTVTVSNLGLNDAASPFLMVASPSGAPISTLPNVPAGAGYERQLVISGERAPRILGPGEVFAATLYSRADGQTSTFITQIIEQTENAVDWEMLENHYRDSSTQSEWESTWSVFRSLVGDTWSDFHSAMRSAATIRWYNGMKGGIDASLLIGDLLSMARVGTETVPEVGAVEHSGGADTDLPIGRETVGCVSLCGLLRSGGLLNFPSESVTVQSARSWFRDELIEKFGSTGLIDVYDLYICNIGGSKTFTPSDEIGRGFASDKRTIDAASRVYGEIERSLKERCDLLLSSRRVIDLDEIIPADHEVRNPGIEWSGRTEHGALVGGLGEGGSFFNYTDDSRHFSGNIEIYPVVDPCTGVVKSVDYTAYLVLRIQDTFDWCPGGIGDFLDLKVNGFSLAMKALEGCGYTSDVALDIYVTPEPQAGSIRTAECRDEDECSPYGAPMPLCVIPPDPCECQGTGNGSGGNMCCETCDDSTDTVTSFDPNEKVGPSGHGEAQWFGSTGTLPYRIYFENLPDATAPAALVSIEDILSDDLSAGSVRLGDIAFGDTVIEVPENRITYETEVEALSVAGNPIVVRARGGVETSGDQDRVFWTLEAIDPATGLQPLDPFDGFLPPNDNGSGEGYVDFTIRPAPGVPTGTVIENEAEIVFDNNEPIVTNRVFNTIDARPPTSMVTQVPPISDDGRFAVAFNGSDPEGPGLLGIRVMVSKDGGAYEVFQGLSEPGTSEYVADGPGLYRFVSQAEDLAGNVERLPADADRIGVVPGLALALSSDTGIVGDSLTSDSSPSIEVISTPGSVVALTVTGQGVSLSDSVAIEENGRAVAVLNGGETLPDGVYEITSDHGGATRQIELTIDTRGPDLLDWGPAALHTEAGIIGIMSSGGEAIEARAGGISRLRLVFDEPIDLSTARLSISGQTANSMLDLSGVSVTFEPGASEAEAFAVFDPPLFDQALYCIGIETTRDVAGNDRDPSSELRVAALTGDVTRDLRVNAADIAFTRAIAADTAGMPIDPSDPIQVASDVNRDGRVTQADIDLVRASRGTGLRGILNPCELSPSLPGHGGGLADGSSDTGSGFTGGGDQDTVDSTSSVDASSPESESRSAMMSEFFGIDTAGEVGEDGLVEVAAPFLSELGSIRLSTTRVAVMVGSFGELQRALQSAGSPSTRVKRWSAEGWWQVWVDDAGGAELIQHLSSAALHLSPLLVDDLGLEMVIPNALVVGSPELAERVANSRVGQSRKLIRDGRIAVVELPALEGADIWRLASDLTIAHSGVVIEPDFIFEVSRGDGWAGDVGATVRVHSRPESAANGDFGAPSASQATRVALLDDGVEYWNPMLAGVSRGLDCTDAERIDAAPASQAETHGTAVAGLLGVLARDWGLPAPAVVPFRVVDVSGAALRPTARTSWILHALSAASAGSYEVVHFGFASGFHSSSVGLMISAVAGDEVLFVAPSTGIGRPEFPADHVSVLAVGRTGAGSSEGCDIVARGSNVRSADLSGAAGFAEGDSGLFSGNSLASARISGGLALLRMAYPGASARELLDVLFASTERRPDADVSVLIEDRLRSQISAKSDINLDGRIDELDLAVFVEVIASGHQRADLDGNGIVNEADFSHLLSVVTASDARDAD